ncbi:hypothetical protein CEN50_05535 [Fischerella thermalis CCMEE 5268]|uniref:Uncharacterized protein n=1 Tax=Fischerella thermalis CCMEE 5268 TaxID=2019662 RepID=A0A2N6KJR0_9CYAN|nr:hypothetical protein [Fischerella thermalis]PLZ99880.1 hypothetical protein CEN50_05535 [Fischerella thermalis CCMEE 5268]
MLIALIVAWLIFTILVKVVKTTVKTAFFIAAIIVLLQVGYGIGPQEMWNYIVQLPQKLPQLGK